MSWCHLGALGTVLALLACSDPAATGTGSITFVQPDRSQSTVLVTGSVEASFVTGAYVGFFDGSVAADRIVRFTVGSGWRFEGTLSANGRSISGRRLWAIYTDYVGGPWTAGKQ